MTPESPLVEALGGSEDPAEVAGRFLSDRKSVV